MVVVVSLAGVVVEPVIAVIGATLSPPLAGCWGAVALSSPEGDCWESADAVDVGASATGSEFAGLEVDSVVVGWGRELCCGEVVVAPDS